MRLPLRSGYGSCKNGKRLAFESELADDYFPSDGAVGVDCVDEGDVCDLCDGKTH